MALYNYTSFRLNEQGLDILWQKQQVIAQNIANSDTPDYKCKYLSFKGVLKDKLNSSGERTGAKELHLRSSVYVDENTQGQPDGNNVDSDQQSLELAKAQFQYETLIRQVNSEFIKMRTAMRTT